MKRVFGIGLIVLVVAAIAWADFDRDGGVFQMKFPVVTLVSPQDTVVDVDTVVIINVQNDTLRMAGTEFAVPAPAQYGRITFHTGNNADTVRYFSKASGDASDDTLWLTEDLTVATANGDSAIVEWFSDNVAVDTVTAPVTPYKITALEHIVLTARVLSITHSDSCGVKMVFQNRLGDNGSWSTIWTALLDTVEQSDTIIVGDSIKGDQWQCLIITEDSTGGVPDRTVVSRLEAFIRGRK